MAVHALQSSRIVKEFNVWLLLISWRQTVALYTYQGLIFFLSRNRENHFFYVKLSERPQDIEVPFLEVLYQMGPSLKTFEGPFSQQFLLIQQLVIIDVMGFSF